MSRDFVDQVTDTISRHQGTFCLPFNMQLQLLFVFLCVAGSQATSRFIKWSGYTWSAKDFAYHLFHPGPCLYSSDYYHVHVDSSDRLHLKVSNTTNGRWTCSEVVLTESLGYGTYTFDVTLDPYMLDPNVIVGMFTYAYHNDSFNSRELDINMGRWGNPDAVDNAQYVVQPYNNPNNQKPFATPQGISNISYSFKWAPNEVSFLTTWSGGMHSWKFNDSGEVPPPGDESASINFWIFNAKPPTGEQELIVRKFTHEPLFKPPTQPPQPSQFACVGGRGTAFAVRFSLFSFIIAFLCLGY